MLCQSKISIDGHRVHPCLVVRTHHIYTNTMQTGRTIRVQIGTSRGESSKRMPSILSIQIGDNSTHFLRCYLRRCRAWLGPHLLVLLGHPSLLVVCDLVVGHGLKLRISLRECVRVSEMILCSSSLARKSVVARLRWNGSKIKSIETRRKINVQIHLKHNYYSTNNFSFSG